MCELVRLADGAEDLLNNPALVHPIGPRLEIAKHTMLKYLPCHRADVVKTHARIARDGGPALGPENEVLRRTRPGTEPDVLTDGVGRLPALRSAGVGQQHGVADDVP